MRNTVEVGKNWGFCFLVIIMAVEYYCLQYNGKEMIGLLSIYVFMSWQLSINCVEKYMLMS
jgi:hypothetical protein